MIQEVGYDMKVPNPEFGIYSEIIRSSIGRYLVFGNYCNRNGRESAPLLQHTPNESTSLDRLCMRLISLLQAIFMIPSRKPPVFAEPEKVCFVVMKVYLIFFNIS